MSKKGRKNIGVKSVKVKFPLSKKEAASFWATQSYDADKVGLKKRKRFCSKELARAVFGCEASYKQGKRDMMVWLKKWCEKHGSCEFEEGRKVRDFHVYVDDLLSCAKKEVRK